MRIDIEGTTLTGDTLDLREHRVHPAAVVSAIRGEHSPYEIDCPTPGPLHERVGVVREGMGVEVRSALALAARSRGHETPQDERVERLEAELDTVTIPPAPATPGAPQSEDVERLRERVAELRGEVQALDDVGRDPTEAREQLREAAGRLAEVETERAARAQVSERLREVRDARERRLRLEDRIANAERTARADLAEQIRPAVREAVADLDVSLDEPDGDGDDLAAAPPDALALCICRVAAVEAPVVLQVDRFASPAAAAEWLDAPVIRLSSTKTTP